jgi:benzoylsuccinyl-CoA thiolase BbsA subunit
MNENMADTALSGEGTLYTNTVVHIGVKGFATPYVLGWVDIPEKIRLVAQIDCDPQKASELRSGQKLQLVIGKLRTMADGTEIVGYKYRPVDMAGGDKR